MSYYHMLADGSFGGVRGYVVFTYVALALAAGIEIAWSLYKKTTNKLSNASDLKFDIWGNFFYLLSINSLIFKYLSFGAFAYIYGVSELNSLNLFEFMQEKFGLALAAGFSFVIYDFLLYWSHRMKHSSNLFWIVHRFHHSTKSMNSLSTLRVHSLDYPVRILAVSVPMVFLLGPQVEMYIWFILVESFLQAMSHSSIDTNYGLLGHFFVSPRFHRMHHGVDTMNGNYGLVFSVWDRVFKTYQDPKGAFNQDLGIGERYLENGVLKSYLLEYRNFLNYLLKRT